MTSKRRKKIMKNVKERAKRGLAGTLALYMFLTSLMIFVPVENSYALTGGPSQPEVQSFEPIGTSDMVDLFSGDYTYNIPLLDVEGYPINLAYHSGVGMDQEASWVGLGWNVNVGTINRSLRGLPDDFNGDQVRTETNIKKDWTLDITAAIGDLEIFGKGLEGLGLDLNMSVGVNYNSYNGIGFSTGFGLDVSTNLMKGSDLNGTVGLGLNSSSSGGLDISPSVGLSSKLGDAKDTETKLGGSIGSSFNSRSGLSNLSIGVSLTSTREFQKTKEKKDGTTVKKNKKSSFGTGQSASFNLMQSTYTPSITNSMRSFAITGRVKGSAALWGTDVGISLAVSYSEQTLKDRDKYTKSYGYMYSHFGQYDPNAGHDFNRENDGSVSPSTPNLALTNYTYDIFSVSGQGVGGSYRPFRNQVGFVFDNQAENKSSSTPVTVEIGAGGLFHGGTEAGSTIIRSKSGAWMNGNSPFEGSNLAHQKLNFLQNDGRVENEMVVFREANEASVWADPDFYENFGEEHAVNLKLQEISDFNVVAVPIIHGMKVPDRPVINGYKKGREVRNLTIQNLTNKEVEDMGMGVNDFMNDTYAKVGSYNGAHLGQIVSLGTDGMRYVYGQPAYNMLQQEVTFAVGRGLNESVHEDENEYFRDYSAGLTDYKATEDNSMDNKHGLDNYFQRITTPAYAHSYLLTSVLSDDYVDVDGVKGPSSGDLGSYTKFSYDNPYTNGSRFNWRIPVEQEVASYSEGLKSDFTDDKGSYIYGEKEIFYLETIETKNFIAVFHKTNRDDGLGVNGENGGVNNLMTIQKLDSIELFSKPDYNDPTPGHNPTALKTVHFVYDYELCPNTPNSNAAGGGKLTLKKVYFTYRDSDKGKLSPYSFEYSDINPAYNLKGYDRWGSYKENPSGFNGVEFLSTTDPLMNYEYPYSIQDQSLADDNSSAWSLVKVNLPSGGVIQMEYESDDYYYVQHKEAMEMAKIVAVGDIGGAPSGYGSNSVLSVSDNSVKNRKIFFEKDPLIPASYYTAGIENLYFRCLMEYDEPDIYSNPAGRYDFVSGYCEIKCVEDDPINTSLGCITLKPVAFRDHPQGGNDYNPIALAGIQFGQLHLSKYVWDSPAFPEEGGFAIDAMNSLYQTFANFIEGFKNPNKAIFDKERGTKLVTGKSWLRLNNVDSKKLGGGSRIKKIAMNDNWSDMVNTSGIESADYGQEYDYTLPNGNSSGVASYEPQLGGDENPWKQPIFFSQDKKMAPDPRFYQETPLGESFFPSASVGYSRVTVRNLVRFDDINANGIQDIGEDKLVTKNATGSVVHEFYTAKDFPTQVEKTLLDPKPSKTPAYSITSIFKIDAKDYYTASQGFSVITNDMHGKQKSQSVYQEDQLEPITKVEYFYQQEVASSPGTYSTVNDVTVIHRNGTVETRPIGINFDLVADFRESTNKVQSISANLNVDGLLLGFITIPIPMVWPKMSKEKTMYRSAVLTKVVQKFGVLENTRATDLGSVVETRNLAFDAETGDVLLTETTTNFNDKVYSMNIPAYWYYDNMGPAYRNIGLTIQAASLNGVCTHTAAKYFVEGDELAITSPYGTFRAWVTEVNNGSFKMVTLSGSAPDDFSWTIKVVRSGRRNMQSQMMASVTTLTNPLNTFSANIFENVLQASAIEFTDEWRTYCDCNGTVAEYSTNPYVLGTKGNFRPKVSYLHLSDRTQSDYNNNTNIREDGVFKSFRPYYRLNANGKWEIDRKDWTYTAEVTEFNPFGQELQNTDALGRESAAQFGFNQTLAKAVAANAGYRDIGFSSFEDDDFSDCADNHFKFAEPEYRVYGDAHAGKYSVRVTSTNSVTLQRDLQRCDQTGCDLMLEATEVPTDILELRPLGGTAPYVSDVHVISGEPEIVPTSDGPNVLLSGTFTIEYNVLDNKGCRAIEIITVTNGNIVEP